MQRIDELRASVKISETLGSSLKDYQQLIANQVSIFDTTVHFLPSVSQCADLFRS